MENDIQTQGVCEQAEMNTESIDVHAQVEETKAIQFREEVQALTTGAEQASQEQTQKIFLQEQLEGRTVKGVAINDRLGKIISYVQGNIHVAGEGEALAATSAKLADRRGKEGGGALWRLQEELVDTQKKLSVCEARLELNSRRRRDVLKEKMSMQKEIKRLEGRLKESQEEHAETQRNICKLKTAWENMQHEEKDFFRRLYKLVLQGLGMENSIKQLSESVRRLESDSTTLHITEDKQETKPVDKMAEDAAVESAFS